MDSAVVQRLVSFVALVIDYLFFSASHLIRAH